MWAFYLDPVGDEPIFTPSAMNYADAVKWASLKARNMGKKVIYVGESLNEALKIGDFVRYKKDNDFTGGKITDLKSGNAIVKNWDGSESEFKLGDLEYVKSWNEAEKRGDNKIYFNKMSDIDHTRLVKWMGKNLDSDYNDYKFTKGGKTSTDTHTLDTTKLSETELKDLIHYLESQRYKFYTEIWLPAYESVNEREYTDEQRMDMADKGLALPDGSFPIKDLEDLKNAIQAYGRSKDQSATAKFIVKRAKALSAEDLIPDTEDFQKALKETITEGNAFLAARAKAIEEDAEEFEFNGKKYPVLNRPKKLNEELSDNDAYKIIDIGSKFSKEVGGHLLATQTFDTANDFVDYLLSEFIPKKDHPKFLKSVKSLMESDSSEEDTDEEYIDPATLPQSVKDYVSSNYSDAKITKAESDEDGFEVYLSNGLELVFGPDEKFIKAVKES
jgi:hypothetical protein